MFLAIVIVPEPFVTVLVCWALLKVDFTTILPDKTV
jgi:hypothetical protein